MSDGDPRVGRVLLACDWFLRVVAPFAIELAAQETSVAILCRTHAHEYDGSLDERGEVMDSLTAAGVRVWEVPGSMASVRALPVISRIRGELRRWGPDLVHAHENHDPRLLALTRGYPTVLTLHDPRPHRGTRQLRGWRSAVRVAWLHRADALHLHGVALEEEMHRLMPRARTFVVPHGTRVRSSPLPLPESPAVLFFGRLEAYKGLEVLVEAMNRVWLDAADVRLMVAGAGAAAGAVRADDPRIELRQGYVPEADVPALMERARVVVLPYLDGSQSGVGTLAAGYGIPVLVTAVGALPDLALEPAMCVEPGNPGALARAISTYLDHSEDLRHRVLEEARRGRSWPAVTRRMKAEYERVAAGL